jgi:hypothetical protein
MVQLKIGTTPRTPRGEPGTNQTRVWTEGNEENEGCFTNIVSRNPGKNAQEIAEAAEIKNGIESVNDDLRILVQKTLSSSFPSVRYSSE